TGIPNPDAPQKSQFASTSRAHNPGEDNVGSSSGNMRVGQLPQSYCLIDAALLSSPGRGGLGYLLTITPRKPRTAVGDEEETLRFNPASRGTRPDSHGPHRTENVCIRSKLGFS
ncbi:hypothetical protein CLAIMM_04010, partial [Cladophialophora immunda]